MRRHVLYRPFIFVNIYRPKYCMHTYTYILIQTAGRFYETGCEYLIYTSNTWYTTEKKELLLGKVNLNHNLQRCGFVEPIPAACPATWGSAVSSVTSSGGIFSRPSRRREETWPSLPAWCSLCRCSPLLPASHTATGEEAYLKYKNLSDQTILVHPWPVLQMPF